MNPFRRDIPLLAFCQAMMQSGNVLAISASALVGQALATDKTLATLPVAATFISTMLCSIPAAMLMHRIGRKSGFLFATGFGISGGALATWAIVHGQFWAFVAASFLIGLFNGFGNYYRFAAADTVDAQHKGRAVSFILLGGVIAAILGPNLANISREWISGAAFAGSFAVLTGLYMLSTLALSLLHLPRVADQDEHVGLPPRPLRQIVGQLQYRVALVCGALGYGTMSLVMTATPLAMQHHAHPFSDTSFVIQWHVLGMFAPSFVTGYLIDRFGLSNILGIGALLGFATVAINLAGSSLWHFWLALVCLGVSWNFLFIGATTLLTRTYRPSEKARAQAANDFIVFSTVAIASLSAGALQSHFGWRMVNIGVLPLLTTILFAVVLLRFDRSARQAA